MKILHAIALPDGRPVTPGIGSGAIYGAEYSTTLLCRGLTQRGHDVTLVCRPGFELIEHARGMGVRTLPLLTRSPRTLSLVWGLVRMAKAQGAEILVGHNARSCRLSQIAARILGVPSVATLRNMSKVKPVRGASLLIAVSEGVRQDAIAQGIAPQRIVTIHNGADISALQPVADMNAAKMAVGYAPEELVVGVIGRLSAEKGHSWFLQAIAPLVCEFPAARILLVGDGPLRAALTARAADLGLEQYTRFTGYQAPAMPWMAAMDLLVLPSVAKEGFARTLIEAGAMAKPCIASPIGGNDEAIVDGETGFIVPTSDVEALTIAMRKLLQDAHARQVMGNAARARVQQHFSVEQMVVKTESVYQSLLGARAK